jgi:hypothetical protein
MCVCLCVSHIFSLFFVLCFISSIIDVCLCVSHVFPFFLVLFYFFNFVCVTMRVSTSELTRLTTKGASKSLHHRGYKQASM